AEALLRIGGTCPERIAAVLAAARASAERRRTESGRLGLRDGPVIPVIQELRLLTAETRLAVSHPGLAVSDPAAAVSRALDLADRLPSAQRGMLECWLGLAGLVASLPRDARTARRLDRHLARFQSRNPGAPGIPEARARLRART
ncbi:MAG: hypothetical protein HOY71_52755, partial [Nonomuraea sp.]|nr:hypothetical protein [Nonomuraea sp.]